MMSSDTKLILLGYGNKNVNWMRETDAPDGMLDGEESAAVETSNGNGMEECTKQSTRLADDLIKVARRYLITITHLHKTTKSIASARCK